MHFIKLYIILQLVSDPKYTEQKRVWLYDIRDSEIYAPSITSSSKPDLEKYDNMYMYILHCYYWSGMFLKMYSLVV